MLAQKCRSLSALFTVTKSYYSVQPVHSAAEFEHLEIIHELVHHVASLTRKNKRGRVLCILRYNLLPLLLLISLISLNFKFYRCHVIISKRMKLRILSAEAEAAKEFM